MANSELHPTTRTTAPNHVNFPAENFKSYPESIKNLSNIIVEANKKSLPEYSSENSNNIRTCDLLDIPPPPPPQIDVNRAVFKKPHTCGSLFAKCGCNNENQINKPSSKLLLQTLPKPYIERKYKRSSSPALFNEIYNNRNDGKRYSNPDISVNNCNHIKQGEIRYKKNSNTVIKQVYLNHPEINFPITVEIQNNSNDKNCDIIVPNRNNNINLTSNLDYHKYTALAYESNGKVDNLEKEDPASKFLKDFGIFGPMGNGVTTAKKTSNEFDVTQRTRRPSKGLCNDTKKNHNLPDDYEYLKTLVPRLEKELSDLELKYSTLQSELISTKKDLSFKENQVLRLQREIHKLKSVLQQTTAFQNDGDILTSLQEKHAMANRITQNQHQLSTNNNNSLAKKQGVSAESSDITAQPSDISIIKYEKDFRAKQLIKDAILDNDFLKHLDSSQIRGIVDSMYEKEFISGSYVIREGEAGAHLYVSAEGNFEVIKDETVLGNMGPGKAFGELAILYNCTRTASIRVVVNSKVWVLDRKVFQQIMVRTGLQRLQDNIHFLTSVPLLQKLNSDVLAKIADVLEVEFYPAGAYIIRQGASGDTFFIISSGKVKITQRMPGRLDEEEIRELERGDYFGEQALLKEDCRTASVIAMNPGVECLTLDRDSFIQLIGDLSEIKEKSYGDECRALTRPFSSANLTIEQQEYEYIRLNDLDVIATLGVGGFGRVELVQYTNDHALTFALKCLKKQHIVDTQQQEHVFSEKNIMMTCRSPFICRLYRTYRDSKYVYMLLEACLGGEVWTILRDRGCFDDHTTRFITACVVEAFDYLHARGIIYRDLKPENLLLDTNGYVKLVDFGFSKRLGYSSKTWTFCGTPEYVAPETILNKGHDRAVDYWALGILMHELLTGNPPFTANDPMKTYNLILKGIDMIDFAKYNVSRSGQSLIKKLCRDAPSERLGYQRGGIQDIKKHKWFQGFDWDGLKARTLVAPIIQPIRGPCDTANFDCFGRDNDIPPDEFSDWDIDF